MWGLGWNHFCWVKITFSDYERPNACQILMNRFSLSSGVSKACIRPCLRKILWKRILCLTLLYPEVRKIRKTPVLKTSTRWQGLRTDQHGPIREMFKDSRRSICKGWCVILNDLKVCSMEEKQHGLTGYLEDGHSSNEGVVWSIHWNHIRAMQAEDRSGNWWQGRANKTRTQ